MIDFDTAFALFLSLTLWVWGVLGCLGCAYGVALVRAVKHDQKSVRPIQIIRRLIIRSDLRIFTFGLIICILCLIALAIVLYPFAPTMIRAAIVRLVLIGVELCVVLCLRRAWKDRGSIRALILAELEKLKDVRDPE